MCRGMSHTTAPDCVMCRVPGALHLQSHGTLPVAQILHATGHVRAMLVYRCACVCECAAVPPPPSPSGAGGGHYSFSPLPSTLLSTTWREEENRPHRTHTYIHNLNLWGPHQFLVFLPISLSLAVLRLAEKAITYFYSWWWLGHGCGSATWLASTWLIALAI